MLKWISLPTLTVGDMLYNSTVASAVQDAQDEKNAAMLSAIRLVCRKGSPRCFGRCASAPLSEAELAEAVASVDHHRSGLLADFLVPLGGISNGLHSLLEHWSSFSPFHSFWPEWD